MLMLSSDSEYPYLIRTTKAAFWEDPESVKTDKIVSITHLSLGYEDSDCKNIAIKKKAKEEIGTHFGLLGDLCVIALHIMRNVK